MTNPNPANAAFVVREFSHRASATPPATITRRPEPVRRDRLQDQRRPRQLQRDDAVAEPPLGERPGDEPAVHARRAAAAPRAARTRRTPPPTTRARSTQFEYDNGYNNFDVRHTFNLSVLYSLPYGHGRKFGSDVGALTQRAARRLGRRRHRQRAQRPAGAGADRPARTSSTATRPATSSPTRRRAARRSSTCRAAARRATCGGPT